MGSITPQHVRGSIKNTFIEFISIVGDRHAPSFEGLRRTNSCPSISSCRSTLLNDDLNSESDVTGSLLHADWADINDSDDDDGTSWHSPTFGLRRSLSGSTEPRQLAGLVDGKADSSAEAVEPDQAPALDRKRTPLRSKASSFVPKTPRVPSIGEAACSWVPNSLEQASDNGVPHMAYQYEEKTTVILRNLPCGFLRDDLIQAMDAKGYAGIYNLVYLPMDFKTGVCLGYAFVNLATEEDMQRFMIDFDGFNEWPFKSAKVCSVAPSRLQGLIPNVERYRNSPVMNAGVPDIFRPVLFDGNKRVPFPESTRDISKNWQQLQSGTA
jgi:hypothetical protein